MRDTYFQSMEYSIVLPAQILHTKMEICSFAEFTLKFTVSEKYAPHPPQPLIKPSIS